MRPGSKVHTQPEFTSKGFPPFRKPGDNFPTQRKRRWIERRAQGQDLDICQEVGCGGLHSLPRPSLGPWTIKQDVWPTVFQYQEQIWEAWARQGTVMSHTTFLWEVDPCVTGQRSSAASLGKRMLQAFSLPCLIPTQGSCLRMHLSECAHH